MNGDFSYECKINGKSLELSFGFKFLREIDNRLGLKVEQASIGQGVSMLPVGLESGNPVVIGEVLIAATSHLKKQAITINIDEALDEIAENIGLEEFGSDILTELATYDPKPSRSSGNGRKTSGSLITYDIVITCMSTVLQI